MIITNYKPISIQHCEKNLLTLKPILDSNNIKFKLGYGTLLGVIREQNFIKNDSDIDLLFYKKDRILMESLIPLFKKEGFKLGRHKENFFEMSRNESHVDFYFFEQRNFIDKLFKRVTCSSGIWCVYVQDKFWDESEEIVFLNQKFLVFKNPKEWLRFNYGDDWLIPQNKKGRAKTFLSSILCKTYMGLRDKLPLKLVELLVLNYRKVVK
jgi:phosphorylcholine metabolism protein LicD